MCAALTYSNTLKLSSPTYANVQCIYMYMYAQCRCVSRSKLCIQGFFTQHIYLFLSTFRVALKIIDRLYESETKGPVHGTNQCLHLFAFNFCVSAIPLPLPLPLPLFIPLPLPTSLSLSLSLGSCVDFLESWLRLAEKLVDASTILESSHPLSVPPPSQANGKKLMFNPLFNPLAFVMQTQRVVFPCLKDLFLCRSMHELSPKVVELLLSAMRHIYSSEKVHTCTQCSGLCSTCIHVYTVQWSM